MSKYIPIKYIPCGYLACYSPQALFQSPQNLFILGGFSYSPDELNPLTIKHPASTRSFMMIGIAKIAVYSGSKPNILNGILANNDMAPICPPRPLTWE